jgi:hypothetical protein
MGRRSAPRSNVDSLRMAIAAFVLLAATAEANRATCVSALGALGEAMMDDVVDIAWEQCPCDWAATDRAAVRTRRGFGRCVKQAVRNMMADEDLPVACYGPVTRSAKESTCGGRAAGAVTCCVPGARSCFVSRPPASGPRDEATRRCLAIAGASLGGAPSCYDACPPGGLRTCGAADDPDDAAKRAEATIAKAQGKPFDVTDPTQAGLLLRQAPHELPCFSAGRITGDFARP